MEQSSKLALAFAFVAFIPSAFALTIEERMYFKTDRELSITVVVEELMTPSLTLTWPVPPARVLEPPKGCRQLGGTDLSTFTVSLEATAPTMEFSFSIQFPCEPDRTHIFPAAGCSHNVSKHSLWILLPQGWTASACSEGCVKSFDPQTGRVSLDWADVGIRPCEAILVRPGVGETEIRRRVSWMAIRAYVLIAGLAVLFALLAILAHRRSS